MAWWWLTAALANPYASTLGSTQAPEPASPFVWQVPERAVDVVQLVLTVPPGHAVYRDRIVVRAVRGRIGDVVYPEAELAPDLYEPERWRATYRGDVVLSVPVRRADRGELELELEQQGCTQGLCWPIQRDRHTIRVAITDPNGAER